MGKQERVKIILIQPNDLGDHSVHRRPPQISPLYNNLRGAASPDDGTRAPQCQSTDCKDGTRDLKLCKQITISQSPARPSQHFSHDRHAGTSGDQLTNYQCKILNANKYHPHFVCVNYIPFLIEFQKPGGAKARKTTAGNTLTPMQHTKQMLM